MARLALHALTPVLVVAVGCTWPFKRQEPVANTVLASPLQSTASSGPPLLIGPEAAGHAAPVELPPKQAAHACLTTAQEMDRRGQVKEAIFLYEKAREQDPTAAAGIGRRLAVLYDLAGDFAKATAEYEPFLRANPNDPGLMNDVGYSYYCRGDFARAEENLKRSAQIDPKSKRVWLNLGMTLAAQGRYDESLHAFGKAGSEAEARSNLAFVLTAAGRQGEAMDQYRRALALEPGLELARIALRRLEHPPTKDAKEDGKVVRADARGSMKSVAEDVPTIHELEERLKKEDEQRKSGEISTHKPDAPGEKQ
jgi:tetratricopeptide (TPR) repeat protein